MDMRPRGNGRLVTALATLVLIAAVAWQTMEPGRYRKLTLVLLAFFAFRVVLGRSRSR